MASLLRRLFQVEADLTSNSCGAAGPIQIGHFVPHDLTVSTVAFELSVGLFFRPAPLWLSPGRRTLLC